MSEAGPPEEAVAADPAPLEAPSEAATPLLGALAIAVAVMTPLVAYVGNQGLAPMTAFAGLLCLPLLARNRAPSAGMAVLLCLLAWALYTTRWTPVAPGDFSTYAKVEKYTMLKLVLQLPLYGSFVVAILAVSRTGARRAIGALSVSLVAVAVLTAAEGLWSGQLYQWIKATAGQPTSPDLAARNVARAGYVLALLFWPVALVLWRGRVGKGATLVLAAGVVTAAILLDADAVLAMAAASTGAFLLVRFTGRAGVVACVGAVMIYFAFAPLAASLFGGPEMAQGVAGKLSWAARLDAWGTAARLVEQKPFFGWGVDASRALPGVPLHPHDAALQLWLELGLVGVALMGLFVIWLFAGIERLARADPVLAAAAAASAAAYLTVGALSFGIWQEWWLALGALAIAVVALLARSRGQELRGRWPWEGLGSPTAA